MATHGGDVLMPWEHFVCTVCFRENPYAVWLIKQQCSKPEVHRNPGLTRVVISERSAVLEEIRPMPHLSIRGGFIMCYRQKKHTYCKQEENCTFAHSFAELVTWNIKKNLLRSKPTCS